MNTYIVDGKCLAIIDSELWTKVEPEVKQSPMAVPPLVKKQKKPQVKLSKPMRGGRGKLSDAVKDEIRQAFSEGSTKQQLAKKYGVSIASIYNYIKIKPLSQRTKNREVKDYTCANGHEFKSKLLPGEAICPTCHSDDCNLGTLNRPVQDL